LKIRPKIAIAYHRELATNWEQHYRKPAFQARLRVLQECLAGRDIRNQNWLDAGCGSGTLTRFLAEAGTLVVGVDAAEDMIAAAVALGTDHEHSEQLRFEHIETIDRLPAADQSMDGILCSSVLEHVADPPACLAEFARVLRPGGCWSSPCRIADHSSAEAKSGYTGWGDCCDSGGLLFSLLAPRIHSGRVPSLVERARLHRRREYSFG
jgi:ubiquinone/menaquinone biosynthesis C-methylase UbiE